MIEDQEEKIEEVADERGGGKAKLKNSLEQKINDQRRPLDVLMNSAT